MAEVKTKTDNFHHPGPELRGPAGTDHRKRNVLLCRRRFRIAGLNDIFDFAFLVWIHGRKTEHAAGCVPFLFFFGSKTLVPEKYAVNSVVFKSPFELVYNPIVLRSSQAIHSEAPPICHPYLMLRLKIQRSTPTTRCSNEYCSTNTDSIAHSGKDRSPTIGRSMWRHAKANSVSSFDLSVYRSFICTCSRFLRELTANHTVFDCLLYIPDIAYRVPVFAISAWVAACHGYRTIGKGRTRIRSFSITTILPRSRCFCIFGIFANNNDSCSEGL